MKLVSVQFKKITFLKFRYIFIYFVQRNFAKLIRKFREKWIKNFAKCLAKFIFHKSLLATPVQHMQEMEIHKSPFSYKTGGS